MNKRVLSIIVITMVGLSLFAGCGSNEETVEEVETTEDIVEEETAEPVYPTKEYVNSFVDGIDDYYILKDTTSFDVIGLLQMDVNVIDGIYIDDSAVDYATIGTYDVVYNVFFDEKNFTSYTEDPDSYEADFGDVISLTEDDTENDLYAVTVTKTYMIVSEEDAQALIEEGTSVYTDENMLYEVREEVEDASADSSSSMENIEITDNTESTTETTESTETAENTTESAESTTETTESTTETTESTETTETTEVTENASDVSSTTDTSTLSATTHTHVWEPWYVTISYEPVNESGWFPYTEVHNVCYCGFDFTAAGYTNEQMLAHGDAEMDAIQKAIYAGEDTSSMPGGGWATQPVVVYYYTLEDVDPSAYDGTKLYAYTCSCGSSVYRDGAYVTYEGWPSIDASSFAW